MMKANEAYGDIKESLMQCLYIHCAVSPDPCYLTLIFRRNITNTTLFYVNTCKTCHQTSQR